MSFWAEYRYSTTWKSSLRHWRYNHSEKGRARRVRYREAKSALACLPKAIITGRMPYFSTITGRPFDLKAEQAAMRARLLSGRKDSASW